MNGISQSAFVVFAQLMLMGAQSAPPTMINAGSASVLIGYEPSAFTCDGLPVARVRAVEPEDSVGWISPAQNPEPMRFTFNIDKEGRPLGIARTVKQGVFHGDISDLAPSLTATRFPAGQARKLCTAVFTPKPVPVTAAPIERLARYVAMPQRSKAPAVWTALKPADSTCIRAPKPITIRYPDFTGLAETPGIPDYIALYYDIDEVGAPQNIRVITSSANAEFDRRSIDAVARSEFAPGNPVTGCLSRFAKGPQAAMAAPMIPEDRTLDSAATCRIEPDWVSKPPLHFPTNFNRRAIEGWAVIGYDVAPWGATGNVRVLASEPAAEFGEAARQIVVGAKKPESAQGLSGCTERVRFVIRRDVSTPYPENM